MRTEVLRRRRPYILSPSRWPVRWRLAGVSAALTFVILLVFAFAVGRLAEDRLESDFHNELEAKATELASNVVVAPGEVIVPPQLRQINFGSDEALQVIDSAGQELLVAPTLPEPQPGVVRSGGFEVVTRQLTSGAFGGVVYVQYARAYDDLDATIGRLWLFLGVGVAAGAILATLAGLWIARRAMGPIAALTATASEIKATRDSSLTMPKPEADDEVAELARTLDSMLAELDAARNESQQMVHVQREFVADASHELRTPLTSILANLELLADRLGDAARPDQDAAEMVASALRSSRRMRRLVGDLLMLARADAGRIAERQDCDLAEIAAAALDEVRPVAGSHTLELAAPDAMPIVGNADELHRLAVNLLDNAVRHTPDGTRVEAAVELRDGEAVLEVRDNGPGLPEGMEEQVFSRFVRADGPADVVAGSGAGLGLAIVRAVATSHGGRVEAGRGPAGGARFTVTLPAASETSETKSKVSANV